MKTIFFFQKKEPIPPSPTPTLTTTLYTPPSLRDACKILLTSKLRQALTEKDPRVLIELFANENKSILANQILCVKLTQINVVLASLEHSTPEALQLFVNNPVQTCKGKLSLMDALRHRLKQEKTQPELTPDRESFKQHVNTLNNMNNAPITPLYHNGSSTSSNSKY